ncbi:MAG: tRNA (adenosine(37)-N6)-dimethylallyltransferase MiaA [Treponema sp.]|nr:tRNA (adenosine(37)-N6)-dimethylallyltransferase MiaA [Treponema sp.]
MSGATTIVPIVFGPTASGKTDALLRIFAPGGLFSGRAEAICADSMQAYRGMDIGTAKPSAGERALLPHHLIDILDPREQYCVGDFVVRARAAIAEIAGRGALPVVSGGTGFYLRNLVLGLPAAPPSDEGIRLALQADLASQGARALMDELARSDPESAARIHPNDEYRLLRALEVLRLTGRPLGAFKANVAAPDDGAFPFRFVTLGLSRPREELYRRIDERARAMFAAGLPAEVAALRDAGYTPRDPGLRAIGYREFFVEEAGAFRLSADTSGLMELVAMNTRRYAKRQETFVASLPGARRVPTGRDDEETARLLWKELRDFV